MDNLTKYKRKKKQPTEFLTVREAQKICRYKGPESIRRAIYRGELPATRLPSNRTLIATADFWKWFHRHDVKPSIVNIDVADVLIPSGHLDDVLPLERSAANG